MHSEFRSNRSLTSVAAGIALAACTIFPVAASAQIRFGIQFGRTPPPPLRYEGRPQAPGPGFVWTDGYWNWDHGRYQWSRGQWQRPPYPGAYWSDAHYDRYDDGYHFHPGHWDREDHGDHYDWDHYHREHPDRRDDRHDDHHDDRNNGRNDNRGH